MKCDDTPQYFVSKKVLPKSYNCTDVKYPFDKSGCNAVVYITPPQCKNFFKVNQFGGSFTGKAGLDYFMPE